MTSPFNITTTTNSVTLDAQRTGKVSFTVSNTSANTVHSRARITSPDASIIPWFTIEGQSAPILVPAETAQHTVDIAVPPTALPKDYTFSLIMVDESNPDENFTEGPAVKIAVPASTAVPVEKPFPWWTVAVAIVAVILIIGIVSAINNQNQQALTAAQATARAGTATSAYAANAQATSIAASATNAQVTSIAAASATNAQATSIAANLSASQTASALTQIANANATAMGAAALTQTANAGIALAASQTSIAAANLSASQTASALTQIANANATAMGAAALTQTANAGIALAASQTSIAAANLSASQTASALTQIANANATATSAAAQTQLAAIHATQTWNPYDCREDTVTVTVKVPAGTLALSINLLDPTGSLVLAPSNPALPSQQWIRRTCNSPQFALINMQTRKLAVVATGGKGTPLTQTDVLNLSDRALWNPIYGSNGYAALQWVHEINSMDMNAFGDPGQINVGTSVGVYSWSGGAANEVWLITPISAQ